MAIAQTIEKYLDAHSIPYDVLIHPRASNSLEAAASAHIEGASLAKAVLLEDDAGYMMAVLPATRDLELSKLRQKISRKVRLATEDTIPNVFSDCQLGAIPPLGPAYGVDTIWDDSLENRSDIYFEAGDHEELIHLDAREFLTLLGDAPHGEISRPLPATGW
ncbi:MAG: YbaK/EbsC family protein [Betaproteobacteria bacterium]|nr:YbaK/EbsC family protein [Betaproteobacteria bacterium]